MGPVPAKAYMAFAFIEIDPAPAEFTVAVGGGKNPDFCATATGAGEAFRAS